MSCNGCRVLRKGCSDTCILRSSLQWIDSPEAQGHATVFVAKFFGRAGMISFINSVSESQRPALFQSLLYEACGRTVNPVYGAVGLLWSGNWSVCQAAVETVLKGGTLKPASNPNLGCAEQRHNPAASMPMPPTYLSVPSPPSTSQPTPNLYSNPKIVNRPPFGSELSCYAEMDKSTSLLMAATKKRPRSSSLSPPPPLTPKLHHSQQNSGSVAADPEPYISAMPPVAAAAPKKQGAAAIVVPVPRRVVPMSRHLQAVAISCASTGAMAASEEKHMGGRRSETHHMPQTTADDNEPRHWDADRMASSSPGGRQAVVELSLSLNLQHPYQKQAEGPAAPQQREGEEPTRLPSPCSMSVNSEEGSVTTSVDTAEFPLSCCVRAEAWRGRQGEQRQLLNLL